MNPTLSKTSAPSTVGKDNAEDKRNLRDVAEEAGGSARRFLHDTYEQAAELRKTTESKITERPLQAVAIAAVGGLLLGALLRR